MSTAQSALGLVCLGLVLSLDSCRASLALGPLPLAAGSRWRIAGAFGLCDGLSPLAGLAAGHSLTHLIGPWSSYSAPVVLGGYGLSMLYVARVSRHSLPTGRRCWILFGIPASLSVDNLVAGIGLGVFGFPVLLSAAVLGLCSTLVSLVALHLGFIIGHCLPVNTEAIGGGALLLVAISSLLNH